MRTDDLIQQLVRDGGAVHRLHSPWTRAAFWLALSIPYVVVIMLLHPPPASVWRGLFESRFLLEEMAALLTAVTAAVAAFASVVPGYDRRILLLPLVPLAFWLGNVGLGCMGDWLRLGADGLTLHADWRCLRVAILLGIVPVAAFLAMLRRGAPLAPRMTLLLAAVAVAALGNVALRIFHIGDASIMILFWHLGAAAVLTGVAGLLGRHVLNWQRTVARSLPR